MKYAIGIDIGGTNTKLGVVDEKGTVIKRHDFKTTDYKNFASYMYQYLMYRALNDCQYYF